MLGDLDTAVLTDPLLAGRIIGNLLANAIHHTEAGTVALVFRRAGDRALRVELRDSGIGIASDQHALIFSDYYQIGNPARRLAALLDCSIAVRSAPGRGSTFSFTMPLAASGATAAALTTPPQDTNPLVGKRIAIIENDELVCEAMRTLLGAWGATAITAPGSTALLQALTPGDAPDALLSDWMISANETGTQAITRVRERYPGLPAARTGARARTAAAGQAGTGRARCWARCSRGGKRIHGISPSSPTRRNQTGRVTIRIMGSCLNY